jgi:nitroreductase
MSQPVLDFLLTRRSAKPALLTAPGPTPQELDTILTAATRVPDHKAVRPWRFIVFEGEARAEFGRVLAELCRAEEKEPPSEIRLETERNRLLRAPLVIAAISSTRPVPGAPEWEQVLSCGAACFNLCLAANAMGYATAWVTEWYSYSPGLRAKLGLDTGERVAGFIYIGTAKERQPERERPALASMVSRWPQRPN